MSDSINNQQSILNICKKLVASSQTSTRSAVNVKSVGRELSKLAEVQNNQVKEALDVTNTISESMKHSVIHVEKANSDLTLLLNSLLEKITDLNEIHLLVNEIAKASEKIDDLAFLSKMLSLNAAIEVAKIGSAGKGLSVVSKEIKSLANTTDETSNQIRKSIEKASIKISTLIEGNQSTADLGLVKIKESEEAIYELQAVYGHKQSTQDNQGATIKTLVTRLSSLSEETNQTKLTSQKLLAESNVLNAEVESANLLVSDLIGEFNGQRINDIDVLQAKESLEEYRVIDVRRADEFNDELGHVERAKLMTIDDEFKSKLSSLNKNSKYLFVCRSGGRSSRAAREALEFGFINIFNLKGGMLAWNGANLPTSKNVG